MKLIKIALLAILGSVMSGCGSGPTTLTYRAVTDTIAGTDTIKVVKTGKYPPEYMVTNNNLYLWTGEYTPGIINQHVTRGWIEHYIWSFRQKHQELEAYWPEPNRKDGGLAWKDGLPSQAKEHFKDELNKRSEQEPSEVSAEAAVP